MVEGRSYSMIRDSDDDYEIELIAGPEEPDWQDQSYQHDLGVVSDGLRDLGYDPAVGTYMRKAVGFSALLLGTFVIHAAGRAAKPFVPVLAEWVKAREGRTVRLKKGDQEAEAHSVDELERLWEIASRSDETGGT